MSSTNSPASLPLSDRALQPGEDDLLGRGAFVLNLTTILCNAPKGDSVVFALYGRWGEGKTSTLTLLEAEFEARNENNEDVPVVIRFNPWVFSGRERLFAAFFEDIGNAIGSSGVPGAAEKAKKWKRLGAYSNLLGQGLNHVDTVLNVFGASVPGWKLLGKFLNSVGDAADEAATVEDAAPEQNMIKIRGELEHALTEMPRPLLVVLDDLDRLPPAELVEIFQLLKSTVDLPNVHYLLLCDRGNIERNLKKQGLRPDYLEKIVQFSAPLPAIPDQLLHELLVTQLQAIFKEFANKDLRIDDALWTRIRDSALLEAFVTLRDVKRFVGEFRMTLPVFCNGGYFELNPEHFMKLQALRLFCPSVVELIQGRRSLFMKSASGLLRRKEENNQIEKEKEIFIEQVIPVFLSRHKMSRFVPMVRELLLTHGVDISEKELATEKRYFSTRLWFDAYFTLEMPQKVVTVAQADKIRGLLNGSQNALTEYIDNVARSTGEVALVRCLENQFRFAELEHQQALICAILSAAPSDDTTNIGSDGPWYPFLDYFSRWVCSTEDSERYDKLLDLLNTSRNHIFFSALLYDSKNANSNSQRYLRYIKEFANDLGKATARIIQKKSTSGTQLLRDGFWYAQDVWLEWGDKAKLKNWIRDVTRTDDGFTRYLQCLGGFRDSQNEYDGKEYFWINHNRLAHFPSIQDGIKRCRKLRATANGRELSLYKKSEEAFEYQAEIRRGVRVIPKKFPEQLKFKIHNPNFTNGIGEKMALITVRNPDGIILSDAENEKIEKDFSDYLSDDGILANQVTVGPECGSGLMRGFFIYIDESDAEIIAEKWKQSSFIMIFNQREAYFIDYRGKGRLPLGEFRNLIVKYEDKSSGMD